MKHHIKIGKLGEEIACMFLMKHSFVILDRNYRSKTGELDIIAKKKNEIYFFEVKSVSRETITITSNNNNQTDEYSASENMHFNKIDKVIKTAQCYLKEKFSHETPIFKIHGITVEIFDDSKKARVKIIENINIQ